MKLDNKSSEFEGHTGGCLNTSMIFKQHVEISVYKFVNTKEILEVSSSEYVEN